MQPVVGLDQSVREDVEKLRKSDKVRLVPWLLRELAPLPLPVEQHTAGQGMQLLVGAVLEHWPGLLCSCPSPAPLAQGRGDKQGLVCYQEQAVWLPCR